MPAMAVDAAIATQERAGADIVTDGEMRRLFFFEPLTEAAEGVSLSEGSTVVWHDESGGTPSVQPVALTMPIRQARSLATEEYAYARARATRPLKVTLPSPLMFGLLWKPGVSDAVSSRCTCAAATSIRASSSRCARSAGSRRRGRATRFDAGVQDRKLALVAEVARRAWPG